MVRNYTQQSLDNISCFFTDDFAEKRMVFFSIVEKFKEHNIKWALACSCNLFFRGIVDDFNDFDFIVDNSSCATAQAIMKELNAEFLATGGNGFCESDIYLHYSFNKCDIDIICGFRIRTFGTSFYYHYNDDEIDVLSSEYICDIPLIPIEALFLFYAMMEGWQRRRKFKRDLIYEYLTTVEIKFPNILTKSLSNIDKRNSLPDWIASLIHEIL